MDMGYGNGRSLALCAAAATVLLAVIAGAQSPSAVTMEEGVGYNHAGLGMAVPKGFEYQGVSEPFDLFVAERKEKGKVVQTVSASAFPAEPKVTAEAFADATVGEFSRGAGMRNFKTISTAAMTVADQPAVAVLMSYTLRGTDMAAVRVFFLREGSRYRICYMLVIESTAERADALEPMLAEIAKTAKLIPVESPWACRGTDYGPAIEFSRRGFSLRPLRGWYAFSIHSQTMPSLEWAHNINLERTGRQLGQVDYLSGGETTAEAGVVVAELAQFQDPVSSAKEAAKACLSALGEGKLTAEAPATLGGREGYQVICCRPVEDDLARRLEQQADASREASYVVIRSVCSPAQEEEVARRAFCIVLRCRAPDEQAAAKMMNRVAGGFAFMKPTATAPATPSSSQPTSMPMGLPVGP